MVRAMGIDMEQKLKRNGDGKAYEYGLFTYNHPCISAIMKR
jgi:hypothetical protein